jgi:hypothetical protein
MSQYQPAVNWQPIKHQAVTEASHDGWTIRSTWKLIGDRMEPVAVSITTDPDWTPDLVRLAHPLQPGDRPVTASAMRALPLGEILGACRHEMIALAGKTPKSGFLPKFDGALDELSALAGGGPQRGKSLSDDQLEHVVDVYRRARQGGLVDDFGRPVGVTEAVATACNVSRSTAAKRIMAARRMLAERGETL